MQLASSAVSGALVWALILIGAIVSLVAAVAWLRRRLTSSIAPDSPPFTLHELRTLRAEGRLSEEEFQRARDAMLASVAGAHRGSAGDESGAPGGPQNPKPPFKPE